MKNSIKSATERDFFLLLSAAIHTEDSVAAMAEDILMEAMVVVSTANQALAATVSISVRTFLHQ
jgi:hypothetical protein